MILIGNLEEYTTYYFLVYGETQLSGQSSAIVSAQTLEDGNLEIRGKCGEFTLQAEEFFDLLPTEESKISLHEFCRISFEHFFLSND